MTCFVVGLSSAGAAPLHFTAARAPYAFVFPRDHGAHPAYQSEWWYYTGHVRTTDGRRFGYELTFFRFGLAPGDAPPTPGQSRWRGNEVYPAHFALTDESRQTFTHVERFAREALGMGRASSDRLDVHADDWSLSGTPTARHDRERMTLHASANGNAIDFVQVPEKGPAIHGHGGVSRKASCPSCASHYYSYTRLRTTGTLTVDGKRFAVRGLSWMDHEFGSDQLERNQAGWDWFAFQLHDGRELMLYRLRQRSGAITPQSSGSLIERDGTVRYLSLRDYSVESTATWHSPHTNGAYPSAWHVRVPQAHVDVLVTPTVADQELANTTSGVSYWEGAVDLRDATRGVLTGVGYVELTGYAGSVPL